MRNIILICTLTFLYIPFYSSAAPSSVQIPVDDYAEARTSADKIIKSVHDRDYKKLWDDQTSDYFKNKISESSFMGNFKLTRDPLGNMISSQQISEAHVPGVPDYNGDVYSFDYKTKYQNAEMIERVVVINEHSSGFKMSGLNAVKN